MNNLKERVISTSTQAQHPDSKVFSGLQQRIKQQRADLATRWIQQLCQTGHLSEAEEFYAFVKNTIFQAKKSDSAALAAINKFKVIVQTLA